jgi:hypothetical protein
MVKKFPYLEVSGSYRDIGSAIGETFRERIGHTIVNRKQDIPDYEKCLSSTYPYFLATVRAFPQYIEELTAIAQAAGVNFADYFFINTEEVYNIQNLYDHCTIAVSFSDHQPIIGHNEDWYPENIDDLYILRATINDTTFTGLNYAFHVPGASASVNNWGLVQCINDLPQISNIGIPKNFVARAILECKTMVDAETLIKTAKRASGYNHVLVQETNIRNIEISGSDLDIESIHELPYVHTNHFLSKHMMKYETERSQGSLDRYARAKELVRNNMTVEDMKALLRDTLNTTNPICRPDSTIGSVIFVPHEQTLHVCYGHPCAGEYISYKI